MIEKLTAEILAAEKKANGKVIRMMPHEINNTIDPVNSILETGSGINAEQAAYLFSPFFSTKKMGRV